MDGRPVLLYGRSLLLSVVAASLERCQGLRVLQSATWAHARALLAEHLPEVLIFDLTDTCEKHLLPLLFNHPQLLLVGLDAESNRALLISGHEARSLTLNQLREIVGGSP